MSFFFLFQFHNLINKRKQRENGNLMAILQMKNDSANEEIGNLKKLIELLKKEKDVS